MLKLAEFGQYCWCSRFRVMKNTQVNELWNLPPQLRSIVSRCLAWESSIELDWKPWEAIAWSFECESLIALESPRCYKWQKHGMSANEISRQEAEADQKRCVLLSTNLTSDIRYRVIGYGVCLGVFWSCLGLIYLQ